MHRPEEENRMFQMAAEFIHHSNYPVFLTGKAGTGKTTFLKNIKESSQKNTAIVAPTGVAAINAGGTTIHSFFQLPFGPYIPGNNKQWGNNGVSDKNNLVGKLRLSGERREVMQQLELLIIDEISMVRCDVLDAIDAILRHVRNQYNKPFGGIQVLYIGDLYQLPPVVREEEWRILCEFYKNPFFFSSHAVLAQQPVYIELKNVYRQTDFTFIELLNKVRNNEMDNAGYELLHSRYQPGYSAPQKDATITLTTHNQIADEINNTALSLLPEKLYSYTAAICGDFFEKSFPADEVLKLKVGAQVMFIKNDTEKIRRFFNGKIGRVKNIETDKIIVTCDDGNSETTIEVKKETWRNINYTLNKKTQQVEEEEQGTFTQFPLRLAWAITIHKSQGLTFEKAVIDAGKAFSPGQVYVALSRCTSFEGMILKSKISHQSLKSDERIVSFTNKMERDQSQSDLLENAVRIYQQDILLDMINFNLECKLVEQLFAFLKQYEAGDQATEWIKKLHLHFDIYSKYSNRFGEVLQGYFNDDKLPENNLALQERYVKAANWFFDELAGTKKLLLASPFVTDNRQLAKEYDRNLEQLFDMVCKTMHLLSGCQGGFNTASYQKRKMDFIKETFNTSAYSGKGAYVPSDVIHPVLYTSLKEKRDELCRDLELPVYMVCSTQSIEQMANYLPRTLVELGKIPGFGKVRLRQFGNDFIRIIISYADQHNITSQPLLLPEKNKRKPKVVSSRADTKLLSFDLYRQGKSISEIAVQRGLAIATIEGHLAHFIETGSIDINELITIPKQQRIRKLLQEHPGPFMKTIKELMPDVSYAELRWMTAAEKFFGSK